MSPDILPVDEICHQIHILVNLNHFFFLGDLCSQVYRAFLKGMSGFCVNAVLAPHRAGRPQVHGEVMGSRLWAHP